MSLSSFPLILCPKQVLLKNISTEPQVQSKSWTIRVEYYCNSRSPAHHQYSLHFRKANAGAATICFCCTLIWRSGHLSGVHGAAEWFRGPAPKNTEMGSTVCSCQWISNSSKIRDGGTLCCKKSCKWLRLGGNLGEDEPQNTRAAMPLHVSAPARTRQLQYSGNSKCERHFILQTVNYISQTLSSGAPSSETSDFHLNCESCYFSAILVVNKI